MKLIVDTNRIIAALIKNSYTRRIILSRKFEFVTLDFGFSEVKKYKSYILKKTKITEEEFSFIMTSLFSRITVIDDNKISKKNYLVAKKIMNEIDENDVPFLALALQVDNKGIWSDDKHFLQQKKVKVWSTKVLVEKL